MLAGLRCAAWLKARHMRTAFARTLHIAGADPLSDGSAGDRIYQLYLMALALAAFGLLWFAAVDAAAGAGALLGASDASSALRALAFACALLLAAGCLRALRAFPLALSSADIAFLATGPLPLQAVSLASFAPSAAGWALAGAAAGYPLGAGLAAAGLAVDPLAAALDVGLLAAAVAGAPWAVGAVRLARPRGGGGGAFAGARSARARRVARLAALAAGIVLLAGAVAAAGLLAPSEALLRALGWPCAPLLFDVVLAEAALLLAFGARMDATTLVRENALLADMRTLRPASPYEADLLHEARRRRKVALRRPRLGLPHGVRGGSAAVARAALSLARQPEGWPALLVWGAVAIPFGAGVLAGAAGMGVSGFAAGGASGSLGFGGVAVPALIMWVGLASVWMARCAREVGRAHRDDLRVPLVRDRLPFGMLRLLALDILPSLAIVVALAVGVTAGGVALAGGTAADAALASALAALMACAFALCCGLDEVRFPLIGQPIGYEAAAAALAATLAVLSLARSLPLLLAATAAAIVLLAALTARS